MTQIRFDGLRDRIAYYRKLNRMSGDDLATAAGNGVTRSVIANIETGRKSDLTVTQLFAISYALQVPPAALLYDIRRPFAGSGVSLGASGRPADGSTPAWKIPGREFSVLELMEWMGGNETDYSPHWPAARNEVRLIRTRIELFDRARSRLRAVESMVDRLEARDKVATLEDQERTDLDAYRIQRARDREELALIVEMLREVGVDPSHG